jgi:ubiquinone/menaquinone biosynthesis C-methylase UbiE
MAQLSIQEKEAIEIAFWKNSPSERPDAVSLDTLLSKAAEARVFMEKLHDFHGLFQGARDILELGGGQCWASCIVKWHNPTARIVATDISSSAIASTAKWERIYQVKIDELHACRSYDTPFESASFDLVFAYAAAHHFVRHKRTLREIARLLRPGGAALYLHEPACRRFMHRLAVARVNAKRPEVPEDVLIFKNIERLARDLGLEAETRFAPTLTNRAPIESIYYLVLRGVPLFRQVLPCTVDIRIRKLA